MSVNDPSRHKIFVIRILCVILIVCTVLLCVLAPAAFAAENQGVSVRVTVGPCIRVNPDGLVKSNISTVSLEGNDLLTVLAR
jgi:hypothetical protein